MRCPVVALPLSPNIVGAVFYNQAFVVDPLANPLGVIATGAGEAMVGY